MLNLDVNRLVVARAHDQGLVNHTFVLIQEGKHHIQVNERFWGMGQFLYKNMLHLVFVPVDEVIHQGVDGAG